MAEPFSSSHRHLVITGLMGIGKSTTAAEFARARSLPWYDSDRDLEILFGQTGAQIGATSGIDELHRLESAVLLGRLAGAEQSVISAAAWVVEDGYCRVALARQATVVVLDAPIAEVLARIAPGGHRRAMTEEELREVAARRAPLFAAVADLTLDATRPTHDLVASIASHLATT